MNQGGGFGVSTGGRWGESEGSGVSTGVNRGGGVWGEYRGEVG